MPGFVLQEIIMVKLGLVALVAAVICPSVWGGVVYECDEGYDCVTPFAAVPAVAPLPAPAPDWPNAISYGDGGTTWPAPGGGGIVNKYGHSIGVVGMYQDVPWWFYSNGSSTTIFQSTTDYDFFALTDYDVAIGMYLGTDTLVTAEFPQDGVLPGMYGAYITPISESDPNGGTPTTANDIYVIDDYPLAVSADGSFILVRGNKFSETAYNTYGRMGPPDLGSGLLLLYSIGGGAPAFVPEPATFELAGIALVAFALRCRRTIGLLRCR